MSSPILVLYGLSLREISRRFNRHHTTISREINAIERRIRMTPFTVH
ncbi:MAG: helix-turn-helix domain-containing protein [Desulfobacterales bacterium]